MATDSIPYWRRLMSNTVDFTVSLALMAIGSQVLPDAPPPADAMNFFSGAQLANYFATIATGAVGLFIYLTIGFRGGGTLGNRLLGIRLVQLDRSPTTWRGAGLRSGFLTMGFLLLAVPGPVIALLIGIILMMSLDSAFTSADDLMRQAGFSPSARMGAIGISVAALLAAAWFTMGRPLWWLLTGRDNYTAADRATGTTYTGRQK